MLDTNKILHRTKIGIDLHGVIDKEPEKMKEIMKSLMKMNIQVYIVSGPPVKQIEKEVNKLGVRYGVHFVNIFSVVEFLATCRVKMWNDKEDNIWADDEHWWDAKALICKTYGIKIMIDDSDRYAPAFDLTDCEYIRFEDFIK